MTNSVGERIRSRRQELGWTQERLARDASVSKGFLSDLETGKRNVGADTLLGLARALGVSLDFLMQGGSTRSAAEQVQIPAALSNLAKEEQLSYAKTLMLLDMRMQIVAHRSSSQTNDLEKFDWKLFYEAVKSFLK